MTTKTRIVSFERYDVVVVPFPFTDAMQEKRRPALVVSDRAGFGDRIGHSLMAMITSARNARWPLDVRIADLDCAGLPAPSVVRMKLFTLDHRFVIRKAGHLGESDEDGVVKALDRLLGR